MHKYFWRLFGLVCAVTLSASQLARADYQSRCSGCHLPFPNVANEVNSLPNGSGTSGSIRAANNRTYLDTKVTAGMGNFANMADLTGLTNLPSSERDAIVLEIANSTSVVAPVFTSAAPPSVNINTVYSHTVSASGAPVLVGNAGLASPFTLFSGSLPTGLSLNSATGLISGTATVAGTYTGSIRASNLVGTAPTQPFTITISKLTQTISFGAQVPASRNFSAGATFPINPLATGSPLVGAITYVSNNSAVCTVSGTTVTIGSVSGTCGIVATQNGNATYASVSAQQNVAILPVPPPPPTIDSAIPGDSKATFAFSPPVGNGGSPISNYTASCLPGPVSLTSPNSPIVLMGLTNFTAYTCTVSANNIAGSTASAPVVLTPTNGAVPPGFTSQDAATFSALAPATFTVAAAGTPAPTYC